MDDIKIFMADPDGTVPEELIDENSYLLLADEEDEDYPTNEEITAILSELDMEE
jgi:hypothetical protein